MVHALSAEWGWLDRCGGTPRGPRLDPTLYPTLQSVIDVWSKVEGYVHEFLAKATDQDLMRIVEFDFGDIKGSMPVGRLLQHAVTHSVHHRGQVALMIRQLGYTPGNFDVLFYYGEKRSASAAS